jgi:hypothetical protein
MKLAAFALLLGLVAGYLLGGRLFGLSDLRIRFAFLALAGLALQFVNPPGRWPFVLLIVSFVLLVTFTLLNIRTTGFALVLVGVAMNFAVIAINGGMPVAREAIVASGQRDTLEGLVHRRAAKHHLVREDDRLLFLADVIAVPPPVGQVISVGDLFTFGGVGVVVASSMRRRRPLGQPAPLREVPSVHV